LIFPLALDGDTGYKVSYKQMIINLTGQSATNVLFASEVPKPAHDVKDTTVRPVIPIKPSSTAENIGM